MKRFRIGIFVLTGLIIVMAIGALVYNNTLISINDENDIRQAFIQAETSLDNNELYQRFSNDTQGESADNVAYVMVKKDNYAALFYSVGSSRRIVILEKAIFPFQKYKYVGCEATDNEISKYQLNERYSRKNRYLFAFQINQPNEKHIDSVVIVDKTNDKILDTLNVSETPYEDLYLYDCEQEEFIEIGYQFMADNVCVYEM